MPFTLEIVTPERLAWKGEASALVLPTIDGEVGILPKHEPYVTVLGAGEGRITALDGSIEYIAIIGGFVQVRPDRVVVLAESADLSGELDTAAVEKANQDLTKRGILSKHHVIKGITHYGVYREGFEEATRVELEWFNQHLKAPAR